MNVNVPLTEDKREALLAKLLQEPSDTKLAAEFGVSRKTVWRLRQVAKEVPVVEAKPVELAKPKPAPEPVAEAVQAAPKAEVEPKPELAKPKLSKAEDVQPKVDAVPVILSTYFAVQALRGENTRHVVEKVLVEADTLGLLFRKIQVLDVTSVGTVSFVRFRTDLTGLPPLLSTMLRQGRAVIDTANGFGLVSFPSGRQGRYPMSSLCATPKVGFGQTYVGTRIKRWKAQFAA